MDWAFAGAAIIFGLICLFTWLGQRTRTKHANFTKHQVESALENLISATPQLHDEFDMFISWPISDNYLESVRQRAISITNQYPGTPSADITPEAANEIRKLLNELRKST